MKKANPTQNFTSGQQMGRCRVCNKSFPLSELTEEHCPPRCCMEFLKSEQTSIMKSYKPEERPKFRQNGIAFPKTTCKKCNNETFATLYDPALLELSKQVKRLTNTNIVLPSSHISFEVQPVAIMKAVLGHLMAASKTTADSWLDTLARECVVNPEEPIPNELHVFYWFYPYLEYAAVHRDYAMPHIRGRIASQVEVFASMKYFPVAFLVSQINEYAGLQNLDIWRKDLLSTKTTITLNTRLDLPKEWPEIVDATNYLMLGEPAAYSVIAKAR